MNNYTNGQKERMEEEAFNEKVDDLERENLPTANIMVAGITGAGKSTLLNAVFGSDFAKTGKGKPVTEQIDEYGSPDIPIHIWDTVGLELDSEKTKEAISKIRQTIAGKATSPDQFDRIHAIWYCINSGSSRYQEAELQFIKDLYSIGVPFIIVLTQCIGEEDEMNAFEADLKKAIASMGMGNIDVVQVCAKDFKVRGFTITAFGLDVLVDTTMKRMPGFIKSGFAAAQKISKVQKREQCEKIIYSYVRAAKEGFWDKVPLANIICANDKIKSMLKKIGNMYNAQISSEGIQRIVDKSNIDFKNVFHALINPFNDDYYRKVMLLLSAKKQEGFEVEAENLEKSDRVAVMIAFYGYTFIAAIEELWERFTEEQLRDMELVCDNLIRIINKKLSERMKKGKGR